MTKFTKEQLEILHKYVSNPGGKVFVLSLPAGYNGAAMVRYSRSNDDLQSVIVKEFIDEKGQIKFSRADELVERILIQFGDDSVGELEGAHICIEDISNLATKEIEDCRIGGSPIEKSSRMSSRTY